MKQHTHTHRNFSQMINYMGSLNYSQNCRITSLFSMFTLRFILLYDFSLEFFDFFFCKIVTKAENLYNCSVTQFSI